MAAVFFKNGLFAVVFNLIFAFQSLLEPGLITVVLSGFQALMAFAVMCFFKGADRAGASDVCISGARGHSGNDPDGEQYFKQLLQVTGAKLILIC